MELLGTPAKPNHQTTHFKQLESFAGVRLGFRFSGAMISNSLIQLCFNWSLFWPENRAREKVSREHLGTPTPSISLGIVFHADSSMVYDVKRRRSSMAIKDRQRLVDR